MLLVITPGEEMEKGMYYGTVDGQTGLWQQQQAHLVPAPWMGAYGGARLPEQSDGGSDTDTWPGSDEAAKGWK